MENQHYYLLTADLLLFIHFLFVAFVVFGFLLIVAGGILKWQWARNPWFRYAHLLAIAIVVVQSWFGITCPLTIWEMDFRRLAGETTYSGSFIAYWLNRVVYYSAPSWVFVVLYTVFGSLVFASWYFVRPQRFGNKKQGN